MTLRLLLLSLMTAFSAACSLSDAPTSPDACGGHLVCPASTVCQFETCTTDAPQPIELALRLSPPPQSQLPSQAIGSWVLEDRPDHTLTLHPGTLLRGTVRPKDDVLVGNIEGVIEFETTADIPGQAQRFETQSLDGLNDDGFGYELRLLAGRLYRGVFSPTDPSIPRHTFYIDGETVASGVYDIRLPAPDSYHQLSGRLLTTDYGAIPDTHLIFLSATHEVAFSTQTDAYRGKWQATLPPSLREFYVQVAFSRNPDAPVCPDLLLGPFQSELADTLDLFVPEALIDQPSTAVTFDVTQGTDDTLRPAAGRTLTVAAQLPEGLLKRSVLIDESGQGQLDLLPGTYELLITSPPQSNRRTLYQTIDVPDDVGPHTIHLHLPDRPWHHGHIYNAEGNPVSSALVVFERQLNPTSQRELNPTPARFETQVDEDGRYALPIDPGTYTAFIHPDPQTGAPNTRFPFIRLDTEEDGPRDFHLPLPRLFRLSVADPEQNWLPEVLVDLYEINPHGRPEVIHRASTSPEGVVHFLLPADEGWLAPPPSSP